VDGILAQRIHSIEYSGVIMNLDKTEVKCTWTEEDNCCSSVFPFWQVHAFFWKNLNEQFDRFM
jgi:hypothetical protein